MFVASVYRTNYAMDASPNGELNLILKDLIKLK